MWTAFTSANFAYLAKVLALAESFKNHHSDGRFVLMLNETRAALEAQKAKIPPGLLDRIICLDDLTKRFGLSASWIYSHSVVELCTAVKPFVLEMLLEETQAPVMYLDPDTYVYHPLEGLADLPAGASVGLTPHLLTPAHTDEEVRDHEISCLKHGTFNLGFVVVLPTADGLTFARWWKSRLQNYCHIDFLRGLFTDQKWVDLAPSLFPFVSILRHAGANCASWNLSTRALSEDSKRGVWVNDSEALLFFHYSGFNAGTHHRVSKRFSGANPTMERMTRDYIARLEFFDDAAWRAIPWSLARYQDGAPIREVERVLFRHRFLKFANPSDNPFAWGPGEGCRRDFGKHVSPLFPDGLSQEDLTVLSNRLIADLENIRTSFSYRVYQGLKRWKDQLRAPR